MLLQQVTEYKHEEAERALKLKDEMIVTLQEKALAPPNRLQHPPHPAQPADAQPAVAQLAATEQRPTSASACHARSAMIPCAPSA